MMFCSILVNSVARNLWNSLLRLVIWLFDLRGNLTKFCIYEKEKICESETMSDIEWQSFGFTKMKNM